VNASLRSDYGLYRNVDPKGPEAAISDRRLPFVGAPPFRRQRVASAGGSGNVSH